MGAGSEALSDPAFLIWDMAVAEVTTASTFPGDLSVYRVFITPSFLLMTCVSGPLEIVGVAFSGSSGVFGRAPGVGSVSGSVLAGLEQA